MEEFTGLLLLDPSSHTPVLLLLYDVVEQLAIADILHHQEQLLRGFDDLVQLDDVGMPYELENVNLPTHPLHVNYVNDAILLEHLDSYLLAREGVRTQFHFPKGALADCLACITCDRYRGCSCLSNDHDCLGLLHDPLTDLALWTASNNYNYCGW